MKYKINWFYVVLIILFSIIFFTYGYKMQQFQTDAWKELCYKTCIYANTMTNVSNMQSNIIELYGEYNFTRSNYLNCSLISQRIPNGNDGKP